MRPGCALAAMNQVTVCRSAHIGMYAVGVKCFLSNLTMDCGSMADAGNANLHVTIVEKWDM